MWYEIGFPSQAVKGNSKEDALKNYFARLASWGVSAERLEEERAEIMRTGIENEVTSYVENDRKLFPAQVVDALFWAEIDHSQDGKREKRALFEGPIGDDGRTTRKWTVYGQYENGRCVDYHVIDEDGDVVFTKSDVEERGIEK